MGQKETTRLGVAVPQSLRECETESGNLIDLDGGWYSVIALQFHQSGNLGGIMATLTLSQSFNDDWPPDALEGGTITSRSTTSMTYLSALGYTVTLTGTGLTYDADGIPSDGLVTACTVALGGVTYASFAGVTVSFARAGMQIFGFDRQNGDFQNPDPYALFQIMVRGNDVITGSAEDDDIRGGFGNDIVNAGAGEDYVGDDSGNDTLNGGDDWDTLSYDEAYWRWEAFRGVSLDAATGVALDPYGNTDRFSNFERYKDTLYADTLKGANIDENFSITRGNDIVDGRGGNDWVDFSNADRWGAKRGINLNLSTGVVVDSWGGTDTLSNIEGVSGTSFNDSLVGNAFDNEFDGRQGRDRFDGGAGFDSVGFWTAREDNGGHGARIDLRLTTGNILDDGFGNVETAIRIEAFNGSDFGDNFIGGIGRENFSGNDGNDTLNGGSGEDDLSGDWGNDRLIGGTGEDHMSGGGDNDTLTGNTGNDDFNFGWDLAEGGVDVITDFEINIDEIWVSSDWGGLSTEFLVANQFRSGAGVTTANAATQRLIYNTTTGDLYYDGDGTGAAAAVKFATLTNLASLTFGDFHVFL